jgi:NADH-quinone oxidoreductase subunit L
MLGPLVILAILSVIGGFMGWPEAFGGSNWFAHFLAPAVATSNRAPIGDNHLELMLAGLSTLVAFTGWLVAHILYYAKPELPARLASQLHALYLLVKNKYWVDEIYGVLIVTPVLFIARWILGVLIDRGVIDGGGLITGYTAQGFGALVVRIQSGNIRSYAGWLALFAAILLAISWFGWTAHFSLR